MTTTLPAFTNAHQYAMMLITQWEGFSGTAYVDQLARNPVVTVGYGTTQIDGKPVPLDTKVTREQGVLYVQGQVEAIHIQLATGMPGVDLTPWQLGAILSFAYNEGVHAYLISEARAALNAPSDLQLSALHMTSWCMAGGKFLDGLLKRRQSEAYTFLTGRLGFPPTDDWQLMHTSV